MSSGSLLERLSLLDTASPKFHDQIGNILHEEDYKQWVPAIHGGDLVRLVDCLDQVRRRAQLIHPPLKLP